MRRLPPRRGGHATSFPAVSPDQPRPRDAGHRQWAAWGVAALVVAALAVWRPLADAGGEVAEFSGPTMGTTYTVSVDADLSEEQRDGVRRAVDAELERVVRLMSSYDTTSQLSRFNAYSSTEPFAVDPEVIEVLERAREVSERSGGAFDVTVAPLVDAWGFGAADVVAPLPDEQQLADLLSFVGYARLTLDRPAGTVAKSDARVRIDVSGIAQGYAADAVAAALTDLGLTSYLVDVGGELRSRGVRRTGRAWRVGIESSDDSNPVWGTIELLDEGVATSGDYRNWFEEAGVRYAHIIDPRSGRPIAMRGSSVTVVHESAALADAWATALCVLGPDAGFEVARREGLAAAFITMTSGGPESRLTPAMSRRAQAAGLP
ncbi:MAG: FAD:protein FMN transferase [Gemmatimonadetes bacterium]|nr:FAD:protein FMN transferase [Gemmatimonadota bacterium]